jgi:hypothetical protein
MCLENVYLHDIAKFTIQQYKNACIRVVIVNSLEQQQAAPPLTLTRIWQWLMARGHAEETFAHSFHSSTPMSD